MFFSSSLVRSDAALTVVYDQGIRSPTDTARLVRPGESFLGLGFEHLAAAGTGRIVPDGKGGARIEAGSPADRRNDRRRR